jgi:hypothetical protein
MITVIIVQGLLLIKSRPRSNTQVTNPSFHLSLKVLNNNHSLAQPNNQAADYC